MTATRSRNEELQYNKYRRTHNQAICTFCTITKESDQYVKETNQFRVIRNRFPYSIWDGQSVIDHLMITPKKHTDNLGDVDSDGASEYLKLVHEYELKGYNMYARSPSSTSKSVQHQHTHLIKLNGANKRFILLLRKPFYFRWSR